MEESQTYRPPISTTGTPLSSLWNRIRVGCNHMSVIYLNKDFAIVCLALIGLLISDLQFKTIYIHVGHVYDDRSLWLSVFIYVIFGISSGILAYVYPPQRIIAISVILPSITFIFLEHFYIHYKSSYISSSTLELVLFLLSTMGFFMSLAAFHGIWSHWILLHKLSVYHVPIVMYMAYKSHVLFIRLIDMYINIYVLGLFGLIWGAIWLFVNCRKPYDASSYYSMIGFSIPPKLSDIPWKSIGTSMPFVAILLAHVCEVFNSLLFTRVIQHSVMWEHYNRYMSTQIIAYSTSTLSVLAAIFLIEFFPEVNVFSTRAVRRFWGCAYFSSRAIFFLTFSHYSQIFIHDLFFIVYGAIGVFYCFGYLVNHMDLSPRHASVLISIIVAVKYTSTIASVDLFFSTIYHPNNYNDHLLSLQIIVVLVNSIGFVVYYVFSSADLQPWANTQREFERESDISGVISTRT